jgi:hypothetical protein
MVQLPDSNGNGTNLGGNAVTVIMYGRNIEVHEAKSSMSISKAKQILFGS